MPDIIKTSSNLIFEAAFVDGDSRTISIKNPRDDISQSEIRQFNSFIQENNLLIGDKHGSTFGRIKKVIKRDTTTTYLDLSDD